MQARKELVMSYTDEEKKIVSKVDHTLLRTTSTLAEIRALCEAALEAGTRPAMVVRSVLPAKTRMAARIGRLAMFGMPKRVPITRFRKS